ncbi:16432_t:CDS:2, partial [Gigaspora margarita]
QLNTIKRYHYGRKPPYPFTPHIKIIHIPNSKTVYAICKWCEQKHGETYAIENTQCVNKKDRLRPHFQTCSNFKAAVSKDEYKKLMQLTEPSKSKSEASNIVQQSIQPFLVQEYSSVDISHYAKLVLNATIENGWAFNWIEKKSSIAILKFKNPNLVIPSCHTLGGRILKDATKELHSELEDGLYITTVLAKLQDYRDEIFPFLMNDWNQFEDDILKHWKYCAEIRPELSFVALRLHSILVNSASIERLFSSMGFFHTKNRSYISNDKNWSEVLKTWLSMIEEEEKDHVFVNNTESLTDSNNEELVDEN